MSERITSVSSALELLVPPFEDDGGDWAQVLERAEQVPPAAPPRRRPRLRPRILLAAAVLLALLASAPAWSGAGYGRIVHFLTGKPSKKVVENLQQFDEGAPPGQAVRPIVGKTRKVYERRTRYGVYRIWLTPTKTGQICETLEGPGHRGTTPYSAGCMRKTPVRAIEVSGTGGGSDFFRGELDGRVRPGITSLELRYVNGAHEQVPVQNGFFVAAIPAVRMARISDHPTALVGRDRQGRVVASQPLRLFYEGSPGIGMGRPPIARTKDERPLLHVRLAAKTSATLDVSPARGGGTCARLAVARATWTWTCAVPPIRHPLRIDLLRVPTASGTRLLLYGIVRSGVTLRFAYEDGTTQSIPIADDYFLATIPKPRWQPGHRLAEIVAEADGRVVLRVPVARKGGAFYTGPPDRRPEFGRVVRPKPPRPAGPLHGAVQRAEANGVSVEASKGAVNFRLSASAPAWSLLKGTNVSYACFHVRRAHAPWDVDEMGVEAGFARSGQVAIWVERPLDGCEIQGGYGHHWRDRHGTHSAAEIPFDARGRRFFTERATARDLANLVRSRAMHTFRKRGPAAPAKVIVARFGSAVVPLRTPGERPPVGKVGYWSRGNRAVVSEIAPTGTRFFIVLVDGHVSQSNVDGLTRAL